MRDDEKGQDYAPDAEDEYGLGVGAQKRIQKRYPDLKVWAIRNDDPRSGNDGVIDKTVEVMRQELASFKPLRVAAVTTRIYVAALHLDMARAAKRHGWSQFFAAGHDSDPEVRFNRTISVYLTECLTTLRKAAIAAAEDC